MILPKGSYRRSKIQSHEAVAVLAMTRARERRSETTEDGMCENVVSEDAFILSLGSWEDHILGASPESKGQTWPTFWWGETGGEKYPQIDLGEVSSGDVPEDAPTSPPPASVSPGLRRHSLKQFRICH